MSGCRGSVVAIRGREPRWEVYADLPPRLFRAGPESWTADMATEVTRPAPFSRGRSPGFRTCPDVAVASWRFVDESHDGKSMPTCRHGFSGQGPSPGLRTWRLRSRGR